MFQKGLRHLNFPAKIVRTFNSSRILNIKIIENVPALGESITEGTIASWVKNVGDHIKVDDVLVIVETDKVTVDIKSTHSGILTQRLANDNDNVKNYENFNLIYII